MAADRTGQQFGNYRLLHLLGEGGFAQVYLAEHVYLKTQAAIKVLHAGIPRNDLETFLIEARTIASLEHPNIVRVLDFGVEQGTPYLVMTYAPNGTLRQRHPRGAQVPLPSIASYVKQVSEALQYAHEARRIHRDIKPENMLLGRSNEALLSDFGIAIVEQTTGYLRTQGFAGTAAYAAPEQLQGKPISASDQYSLGIVIYEWLSGSCPFIGSQLEIATQHVLTPPPPLLGRVPLLPAGVEQVVLTALAKDPKERFRTIRAFAAAFEQASNTQPSIFSLSTQVSAPPPSAAPALTALPTPPGTPTGWESLSTIAPATGPTAQSAPPAPSWAGGGAPPSINGTTPTAPAPASALSGSGIPPDATLPTAPGAAGAVPGVPASVGPWATPPLNANAALPAVPGVPPQRKRRLGLIALVAALLALALLAGSLAALGASGSGPLAFLGKQTAQATIATHAPGVTITTGPGTTGTSGPGTTATTGPGTTATAGPTATVAPTATPTSGPTATPTRIPTATSTPAPVVKFALQPQSGFEDCTGTITPLNITLDNTGSNVAVNWQVSITDQDPAGNIWATASSTSGVVGAGQAQMVTLTLYSNLCNDGLTVGQTYFHASFGWFTSGPGGSGTIIYTCDVNNAP